MTTSNQVSFHAMPDSAHLTHTWCGYALLALTGLSPGLTSGQVERVTLNGIDHKWRPIGGRTLMLIPAFKQEAQIVVLHLIPSAAPEAPKPFKTILARAASPDYSVGLTPPNNRYERAPQ
ncbi:MAG: hypothetical protein HHJ16_06830 [Polaromonas sp.]|uniref:hypothetical protein n=1 Tax=Polaromonas sp. TaxID=1869339 RepID=UPI0017F4500C|nr:hypothetical protein [Polaromonas sp.]NMM09970.1 hypothetical protein [Polaromonas sp.]